MAIRKGASKPPVANEAKGAALPGPRTPKQTPTISGDGNSLTVHIPISLYRTPGRKLVIAPTGSTWAPQPARLDNTLVKALARAFRWRKLLETGVYSTIEELAAAERVNPSYVSRVLRLTLLAPDLVDAILDGKQPNTLQLNPLLNGFPTIWADQE